MGDGQARLEGGLTICTDSFSIVEIVSLMNILMIRYRFNCKLRKHGSNHNRIYISQHSIRQLQIIVQPFMSSSMIYKISKKIADSSLDTKNKINNTLKTNPSSFLTL